MDAEFLENALRLAGVGTWTLNIETGELSPDIISCELLCIEQQSVIYYKDLPVTLQRLDAGKIESAIDGAILDKRDFEVKFCVIYGPENRCQWIQMRGRFAADDNLLTGTLQHISPEVAELKTQTENDYRYISLIEEAPVATALYAGRDLIIEIANDIMLGYWGKDRSVIGMKLDEALPELEGQPFIEILKNIFDTGETYQVSDAPVVLAAHGVLGTYYFDFTYKPLYNSNGEIYAIMNMAIEVTEKIKAKVQLTESEERYRTIIEHAPVATCLFVGREFRVEVANDTMLQLWGKGYEVIGLPLAEAVPELVGQPFLTILDNVFATGQTYTDSEAEAVLRKGGELGTYYFDFTYKPLYNADGEVYAIMDMAVDVTERVMSRRKVQQSEARFRAIIEQSPMAIGLLTGEEMVIEIGNDKVFEVWGKTRDVAGQRLIDALPELEGQPFLDILDNVYRTGKPFQGYDMPAKLEHDGRLVDVYFDFIYSALRDVDGKINGVLVLANDVTQRMETLKEIAASESKFRALMNAAPAAMILFVGKEDMIIDTPNQAMLNFIDRDESINGKPLLEAVPEIAGTESLRLIQQAFETGIKNETYGRQVKIKTKHGYTHNYYNITYTPLFDGDGHVYAVLDTAIDVTASILSQRAIAEAEASLRGAIELAELGTWELDVSTRTVTYSNRLLKWFGFEEGQETVENVLNAIDIKDRDRIKAAIGRAVEKGNDGLYDEIYTIKNVITGHERILHAQGRTTYNESGNPIFITGTAQDITSQRQLQLALENEVSERTRELQTSNRGLEEANRMLLASNEELAQYAYVASHDLQEPLRKITMYSNLLNERDSENKYSSLTDKIVRSSKRMSLLIKDLLEFSRLLNTDARFVEADLNTIVHTVKDDFELLIQEKDATVEIGPLPTLLAVPLQMNQLFYNLISNALKFVPQSRLPFVKIHSEVAAIESVRKNIPNPQADIVYNLITVSDNGIGIESQYEKQIFEVFKRLHGRDEYSGSGIGLAICRRIAINHGGAIYTESEVGKGTTFCIILPGRQ